MINLNVGITPPATTRPPLLRADRIRRDTLTMLAAALREDDDNAVRDALDALIDAGPDAPDVEIDALIGDIEDTAGMGRAVMALTETDVRQLAAQATAALPAPRPVTAFPQHERRAS